MLRISLDRAARESLSERVRFMLRPEDYDRATREDTWERIF